MAELEIELLRTKERVRVLEEVVKQQSEALKEGSRLLVTTRICVVLPSSDTGMLTAKFVELLNRIWFTNFCGKYQVH